MRSERAAGKQREVVKDATELVAEDEVRKVEVAKWRAKKMMWELEGKMIDSILENLERGW
jgi:hypothetical protein